MKPITMKLMALLLAILMAAAIFGGCKKEEETTTTAPTAAPTEAPTATPVPGPTNPTLAGLPDMPTILREDPDYLEFMDDISPITITIYQNMVQDKLWAWGENPVEQHITELTGVTLDGRYAADADGTELTLMLASGEKLPDIIAQVMINSTIMQDMIEGEAIYKINDLIDQYCPLMEQMFDPIYEAYKDENGDLWYLPRGQLSVSASLKYPICNGWFAIRQDIVDALGNPPLNTIDDMWAFLELWETNKDQWPEIKYPIAFPALNNPAGSPCPWYNSYGGHLSYDGGLDMVYDNETDTVHFWVEDEYGYNCLKLEFDLAQAGYVTQESFAIGGGPDEVKAGSMLIYTERNVWSIMYNGDLAQNVPGAFYKRIEPIAVSEDVHVTYGIVSGVLASQSTVIPKDCTNPERTIKFMEFLQTEYANALVYAGIYGVNFEMGVLDATKGTTYPKFIGEAAAAGSMDARFELGIYNYWKDWINCYGDYDMWGSGFMFGENPGMLEASARFINDYYEYVPAVSMNGVAADDEMSLLRTELQTIIGNYQTQMILAANEAEFDALYDELLTTLEDNGLQSLKDFVLPRVHDIITAKEAVGVVFK